MEFVNLAKQNAMGGGQQMQQPGQAPQGQPQGQLAAPQNLGDEYGGGNPQGERRETYMRNGSEYMMPREANPGSANERRGAG